MSQKKEQNTMTNVNELRTFFVTFGLAHDFNDHIIGIVAKSEGVARSHARSVYGEKFASIRAGVEGHNGIPLNCYQHYCDWCGVHGVSFVSVENTQGGLKGREVRVIPEATFLRVLHAEIRRNNLLRMGG
jgi:hypothetical protein